MMLIVLRLLTIMAVIVFLLAALMGGGLFWQFNFGDCKDGCAEGMAAILILPALFLAGISLIIAIAAHVIAGRVKAKRLQA